jgi:hypothetical protein
MADTGTGADTSGLLFYPDSIPYMGGDTVHGWTVSEDTTGWTAENILLELGQALALATVLNGLARLDTIGWTDRWALITDILNRHPDTR